MRIDAHQHYWKIERDDYGWITPELQVLYRDFLPEDLVPHLEQHQMNQTIVIQVAPSLEETEFILSLSEKSDTIGGVVGWLDLEDPAFKEHFERFRKHPKYVGFRIMIQEMKDPNAILQPHFVEALSYFAELDVPVDLLVLSHQLDAVVKLLKQVPGLRGVIDHLAKPRIADGEIEPWKSQIREIAKHPNIYCKLSGMVTEADHMQWQPDDFVAYVRHIIDTFGTHRVMFGSDWPVCLLAASYDQMMDVLIHSLPEHLTESDKDNLFGNNAKDFYKLSQKTL